MVAVALAESVVVASLAALLVALPVAAAVATAASFVDPLAQAIAKNASAMMLIKMIDNFFIFQVFLSFQSMKIVVYLF